MSLRLEALPTDEEVAAYRRDGFYIAEDVIPADVLDAAEEGMARFYAGDHDAPFPGTTSFDHIDWTPEHGNVLRKNDFASLMVTELAGLVRFPAIAAIAARLSGATQIRLWHDQLLYKPPGVGSIVGNVGWHTDRQYWQCCTSTSMLTAWVPFHDCDEATGGVTFVRGSHEWEQTDLDAFDQNLDLLESRVGPGAAVEKVTPHLRRGSLTFHHCGVIHGSGPNVSEQPRRSIAIHLQPGDNRYAGTGYHRSHELAREVDGAPDYTDPRLFPLLADQENT
jgi:ectoine hydroxylase-related dioxygenase (phytanoyl-CoA dioxygenase family)